MGKLLASKMKFPFFDTDEELSRNHQTSPGDYLRTQGESKFRVAEFETLRGLVGLEQPVVCATGGGLVTYGPSVALLQKHFFIVWLRIQAQTVIRRLEHDPVDRPLLTGLGTTSLASMLERRLPAYEHTANAVVDVDTGSPSEIAEKVLQCIHKQKEWPVCNTFGK